MITVKILEDEPLEVELSDEVLSVDIVGEITEVISSDIEHYKGDYVVTPKVSEQSFPTANKLMDGDVTVKAIPYYEVTNTSNGQTVIIGE